MTTHEKLEEILDAIGDLTNLIDQARTEGAIEEIEHLCTISSGGFDLDEDGYPLYFIDMDSNEIDDRIKALKEGK